MERVIVRIVANHCRTFHSPIFHDELLRFLASALGVPVTDDQMCGAIQFLKNTGAIKEPKSHWYTTQIEEVEEERNY